MSESMPMMMLMLMLIIIMMMFINIMKLQKWNSKTGFQRLAKRSKAFWFGLKTTRLFSSYINISICISPYMYMDICMCAPICLPGSTIKKPSINCFENYLKRFKSSLLPNNVLTASANWFAQPGFWIKNIIQPLWSFDKLIVFSNM